MFRYLSFLILILPLELQANNLDIEVLREINLERNKGWDGVYQEISNSVSLVTISVPFIGYGVGLLTKNPSMRHKSLYIGASVVSAGAMTMILKYSIDRTRPFITYPDLEKRSYGGSPSFPSGHTSGAFSIATSMSMAYPKWYVIAPAFLWAGAVGYSRMDLGVHYPSDVLIGAVLGVCSGYLWYKGQHYLTGKNTRPTASEPSHTGSFKQ